MLPGSRPSSRAAPFVPRGGARWRYAPLLALRAQAEERERAALERALAAACRAEEEASIQRTSLALARGRASPGVAFGWELAAGERFQEGLRRELSEAMERARAAQAAAGEARGRHARARQAREGLERERERWLEARRGAREASIERELDDIAARKGRT